MSDQVCSGFSLRFSAASNNFRIAAASLPIRLVKRYSEIAAQSLSGNVTLFRVLGSFAMRPYIGKLNVVQLVLVLLTGCFETCMFYIKTNDT